MQTVNFQCGHCGKLMAVGVDFLGQQVRCPHCQQVVLAPGASTPQPPAPAPAPFPALETPPVPAPPENPFGSLTTDLPTAPVDPFRTLTVNASEDIFSTRKEPDDALFGESDGPRLEIPRDIVPSAPAQSFDMPLSATASPPPAMESAPPVESVTPPSDNEHGEDTHASTQEPSTLLWSPVNGIAEVPSSPLDGPAPEMGAVASPAIRKVREESARINWFIPLVFLPLILYAILATVGCAILYMRIQAQSQTPSLWEQFPDVDGDAPGVRPKKPKGGVNIRFKRDLALAQLPEKLHVKLGETLQLGDLEVTPLKVRRQRVKVVTGTSKPQELPNDSLVLTLRFRNLAQDYSFAPMDNYFDRHWDGNQSSVPLTVLVAGTRPFFGGPAKWFPLYQNKDAIADREWLELPGRKKDDRQQLEPGESMETCICTDGDNKAAAAYLFGTDESGKRVRDPWSGKLLWRVQVRRGRIDYDGKPRSAVAVIGVEFTSGDYAN